MDLPQVSEWVAIASAVVAVGATAGGIFESRRASRLQQEAFTLQRDKFLEEAGQWKTELERDRNLQEVNLRKEFHLEQYRHRLESYGPVLRTLGAISDVNFRSGPNDETSSAAFGALHADSALLQSTADALYVHLYGEPGLLMTMRTRNRLHHARRECIDFLRSSGDVEAGNRLINAFFYARRYLRADLELLDERTSPASLEGLVAALGNEVEGTGQNLDAL